MDINFSPPHPSLWPITSCHLRQINWSWRLRLNASARRTICSKSSWQKTNNSSMIKRLKSISSRKNNWSCKRLCSENSRLKESVTENQQLLHDQEAEINIVTAEQLKLKDETICLCSENSRLKESLNESQQLLHDQKAEINLRLQNSLTKTQQLLRDQENEINLIKEDQLRLKDETKRLSSQNNVLQKSLTKSQQLLQQAEFTIINTTSDRANIKDSKYIHMHGGVWIRHWIFLRNPREF